MTDREAFEACPDLQDYCDFSRCPDGTQRGIVVYNDPWTQGAWQGWQAALASERAKQAEPVPFNAPGKAHVEAMLGSAAPPAVPAEPVALHIDDAECVMYAALRAAHERGPVSDDKVLLDELAKRGVYLCRAAPSAVQAEPVAFVITDEKINFLQVNSIKRFIERAKHAHFTDIYYRINGKDEVVQADWLKHLQLASPPAVPAKTQGYTISRDEEWNLVVTEGTYEDAEAVRLLEETLRPGAYGIGSTLASRIDTYLAKVKK